MQKALYPLVIFSILTVTTAASAQFGKEWLTCKTDEDCHKVNGLCGRKDSINKKFIKDFEVFVQKMGTMSSCAALSEKEKQHNENSNAKCIANQCKLEDIK